MALPRFRGDRLLEAREAAGLSREAVTLALGLSTPLRIKMWEAGFERLQTRFIPALAAAVNVEPLVLLDVDPDDPPLAALRIAAGIVTGRMGTAGMSVMSYQRIESGRPGAEPPARVQRWSAH